MYKILLIAVIFSACDIISNLPPTTNSCDMSEAYRYFEGELDCIDLQVPLGMANEAKQLCGELGGVYVPSLRCPVKDNQLSCRYILDSPNYISDAVAWYRLSVSDEVLNIMDEQCKDLRGTLTERNNSFVSEEEKDDLYKITKERK